RNECDRCPPAAARGHPTPRTFRPQIARPEFPAPPQSHRADRAGRRTARRCHGTGDRARTGRADACAACRRRERGRGRTRPARDCCAGRDCRVLSRAAPRDRGRCAELRRHILSWRRSCAYRRQPPLQHRDRPARVVAHRRAVAALVRSARADVPARGGRTHRRRARLQELRAALRAGRLAHGGEDPVRHRAFRIRAAAEGDVLAGAACAAHRPARVRPARARARHRGSLRPAPQDAAAKLEAARRRSAPAPRTRGARPDGAGGGYSGARLRRARQRNHMSQMIRQSMTAYATPLCETIVEAPEPRGTEVLVRISRCGVCHSDLHLYDGYFSLGGDKKLDVTAFRTLPFTLGHEIAGVVEKAGPDADAKVGTSAAVFPWIGCGECAACKAGEENLCALPRHLGIQVDGGFATHVLVPHPRYLIDHGSLSASLAGAYMCSGLTAFSALKRLTEHAKRGPVLLVGLGGVGMMGLAFALALFPHKPIVADIDPAKRDAALKAGAAAAYHPADPAARKALMRATGGVPGAVDFAGTDGSLAFATGSIAKGGKVVITGLIGGTFATPI